MADGFSELGTFLTVLQGQVQTALGAAQPHGTDGEPSPIQGLHHLVEAVAPGTQHIFFGHAAIVKIEFTGVGSSPHELPVHFPSLESRRPGFNENARQFRSAIITGSRAAEGGDSGRNIGGGIGNKNLAAIDDPFVSVQNSRCFGVGGIRTRIRFRQAKSPEGLPAAQLGEIFLFLLFTPKIVKGTDAQGIPGSHGCGMGAVHTGDFFGGDNIRNVIHALAAIFFGDEHPEKPQFRHFPHGFIGKHLFFIQFSGNRLNFIFGKITNRIP